MPFTLPTNCLSFVNAAAGARHRPITHVPLTFLEAELEVADIRIVESLPRREADESSYQVLAAMVG
jgi:hypothetical protein